MIERFSIDDSDFLRKVDHHLGWNSVIARRGEH